jgi:hypothetical protein
MCLASTSKPAVASGQAHRSVGPVVRSAQRRPVSRVPFTGSASRVIVQAQQQQQVREFGFSSAAAAFVQAACKLPRKGQPKNVLADLPDPSLMLNC